MNMTVLSLALGMLLAGPVAARANEFPLGPVHSQRTVHPWAIHRHSDFLAATSIGATAQARRVARRWRDPFKPRTTDGLSSNINACASYGCVDAGSQ
jgi:hypothetical protein